MSMFALVNDSQYVQYQYIKIVLDTSGCEEDAWSTAYNCVDTDVVVSRFVAKERKCQAKPSMTSL